MLERRPNRAQSPRSGNVLRRRNGDTGRRPTGKFRIADEPGRVVPETIRYRIVGRPRQVICHEVGDRRQSQEHKTRPTKISAGNHRVRAPTRTGVPDLLTGVSEATRRPPSTEYDDSCGTTAQIAQERVNHSCRCPPRVDTCVAASTACPILNSWWSLADR